MAQASDRSRTKGTAVVRPATGDPNTARHSVLEAAGAHAECLPLVVTEESRESGDSRTAGAFLVKVRKWHVLERFLSKS